MHYELNPASVFENIAANLSPNGVFILECGVIDADTKEMRLVQRHSDTQFYPTSALLRTSLSDLFDVKEMGFPETPVGDPIPRHVFHCMPRAVAIVVLDGTPSSRNWRLVEFVSARRRQRDIAAEARLVDRFGPISSHPATEGDSR